jgi:hypothetical protein
MAFLSLTFGDVVSEISEFLGRTDEPTGRDRDKIRDVVNRGYRKFLYPTDPRTGRRHTWSFLQDHGTLALASGQWKYAMPSDFDELLSRFRFDDSDDYGPPSLVTAEQILQKRNNFTSESWPRYVALFPSKYDKAIGQQWEAWFYDTPNAAYTLHFIYQIRPPKLDTDTDVFVGGDFASEAILENALAVAELKYHHVLGVHNAHATELTQRLIMGDRTADPDTYGLLYDPSVMRMPYSRPLPPTDSDNIYTS